MSETKAEVYCESQWAHKAHTWYDKKGVKRQCPGATTAQKPNKAEPAGRG